MRWGAVLFWLVAFAAVAPSAGAAKFEIAPGGFAVRALDAVGQPEGRAGAHPDRFQIDFALDAEETTVRDVAFELPPGFGGGSGSVPLCPRDLFEKGEEECPEQSRVGTLVFRLSGGGDFTLPIFELEPREDELIAFGSSPALGAPLRMELRPDDFGLTLEASDLPEAAVDEGRIELWGVPADHQVGTSIPRRPFLTMPTRCGSLDFGFRARSWEPEAAWLDATAETEVPLSGCEHLAFEPQLELTLDHPLADSPSGARIDLSMQENADPDGLAVAQIKDAVISLPDGLTVSPGGAAGMTACTDAQLGLGNSSPSACPDSSRVGSAQIETPLLPLPLTGNIYLGEEKPGERFRIFVVASRLGAVSKFVSTLQVDPATGRLSAALEGIPQLALKRLSLSFDGGERALLATPLACGSFPSRATFVSHGGSTFASAVSTAIGAGADGSPCPAEPPFSPSLEVVQTNHGAGRSTAISMTLRRRPGEQLARRFAVTLPRGLSAALGEVEPCPDALAGSGACPPASKVGDAFAEVGSGSSPLSLRGDVYAAGAYRDSPFSLVLALNASIGPFDLASQATRAALRIHPRSGRVTVVTDPLPSLIEGIPIRLRALGLSLSRPGAVRNPTSCAPAAFDANVEASSGAVATLTREIAVSGCHRLGFEPRVAIALSGRSQMRERGRPGLSITARLRRQDTGLRALRISLPTALKFRLSGVDEICPRRDARAGLCTSRARVGVAQARTPLVDRVLRGSVYVVQPHGDGLPDLWVSVASEGLRMNMQGKTSQHDGRFVAKLAGLPDMPLSTFSMRLRGGRQGALSLAVAPCAAGAASALAAPVFAKGQNGAIRRSRLRAKAPCGAVG